MSDRQATVTTLVVAAGPLGKSQARLDARIVHVQGDGGCLRVHHSRSTKMLSRQRRGRPC
jgi:hypothetical protein